MIRYILRRIVQLIPTIFGIYTLTFFLMRVLPGDPATFLVGFRDDEAALDNLKHVMKLDEPVWNQYVAFVQGALRGDLGRSYLTGQPVTEMIAQALPYTIQLAVTAMTLAVIFGIPLGMLAALRKDSAVDNFSRLVALIGVSIPVFWLGVQLQIWLGLQLKLLPISGPGFDNHMVLPAFVLCLATLALLTRMTRSTMLEQINQDYVRTARSKGLHERVITVRHILRNSLIPVVTVAGASLANLLSGSLVVEVIFNLPGMGRLLVQAFNTRDYALLQGLIIVFALIYAGANLLIDISYPFIDPRIRLQ